MPRENSPDVTVPIIFVNVSKAGYSPQDSLDLLAMPMEREFSSLKSIDTMQTFAGENYAGVLLQFDAFADMKQVSEDVNRAIDKIQSRLPKNTDRPTMNEFKVDSEPIAQVTLLGDASSRYLSQTASKIKTKLELLPSVLEVDSYGDRKEMWEVLVDPQKMDLYGLSNGELTNAFRKNNQPVGSGSFSGSGGFVHISVSGRAYSKDEMESIVIRSDGNSVVKLGDVANISYRMTDEKTIFRVNGKKAVNLLPKKYSGYNLIDAAKEVRALVKKVKKTLPDNISLTISNDLGEINSKKFNGLNNTILASVILVMLLSLMCFGIRSALLVGSAIPLSFLMCLGVLYYVGWTLNSMVLFALLTSSGLLVDMAVVVVEIANRLMRDKGYDKVKAYREGARMMSTPIIASSLTTLVVFLPLGFWPGIIGKFMMYFPLTMLVILSCTLVVSLVFLPSIGSVFGGTTIEKPLIRFAYIEDRWSRFVAYIISSNKRIYLTVLASFTSLIVIVASYFVLGRGIELFPDLDTEILNVEVYTRGNLSLQQKENVFKDLEKTILSDNQDFVRVDSSITRDRRNRDFIGKMVLHLKSWREIRPFEHVRGDLRKKLDTMNGLTFEIKKPQSGPPKVKDMEFVLLSPDKEKLDQATSVLKNKLVSVTGIRDVFTDKNQEILSWSVDQKIEESGLAKVNLGDISNSMMMLFPNGLKLGERNTETSRDSVDIIARTPQKYRSLGEIDSLRINSAGGAVPIKNISTLQPIRKMLVIKRYNQSYAYHVSANVTQGHSATSEANKIREWFYSQPISEHVVLNFEGAQKDLGKNKSFLASAFAVAMCSMLVILVAILRSFYKSFVVLTAVFMSTTGVFVGLLVTLQPFSLIMTGLGIIALAGIIVNNNIVLIDAYNRNISIIGKKNFRKAIVMTVRERLRPILLMVMTSVISLTPAVFQVSVDIVGREINFNDPSIQITKIMSTAIVFGLIFATPLTLVVTPCLIAIEEIFSFRKLMNSVSKKIKWVFRSLLSRTRMAREY